MGSKVYFDTVASEWSEMRKAFFSEAIREKAFEAVNLEAGKLAGVFTDGDLRRALDQGIDVHKTTMQSLMHRDCIVTGPAPFGCARHGLCTAWTTPYACKFEINSQF